MRVATAAMVVVETVEMVAATATAVATGMASSVEAMVGLEMVAASVASAGITEHREAGLALVAAGKGGEWEDRGGRTR